MKARAVRILACGVGILVAVTLAIVLFVPDFEVTITEDEVRERIADALPLSAGTGEVEVRISDARVDFLDVGEKGQVALQAEIRVSGLTLAATAEVDTVTAIRYDDGSFYLSDLRLDDLTLTPTLATKAKLAALRKAWQPVLDQFVEEFEANGNMTFEEARADMQRSLLPLVRRGMDDALRKVPVFTLGGTPATVAAALVLKDVSFADREAIAVLSPAQAMIKIATAVIGALIAALLAWEWYRAEYRRRTA